jgi:hypothetical protein
LVELFVELDHAPFGLVVLVSTVVVVQPLLVSTVVVVCTLSPFGSVSVETGVCVVTSVRAGAAGAGVLFVRDGAADRAAGAAAGFAVVEATGEGAAGVAGAAAVLAH